MAEWKPILEPGKYDGFEVDTDFLGQVKETFGKVKRPMLRRGHRPKSGAPSAGDILGVRIRDNRLEAEINPTPDMIEDVRAGRYRALSPGFVRIDIDGAKKWILDHIAALGEEHPAFKNQPALSFSELNFAEPEILEFGERLASMLNSLIDDATDDNTTRADIVRRMGREAGIDANTVNEILNGSINCPPIQRLRGFARALDVPVSRLIEAARRDGCTIADGENMTKTEISDMLKEFKDTLMGNIRELFVKNETGDGGDDNDDLDERIAAAEQRLEEKWQQRLNAVEQETKQARAEADALKLAQRKKEIREFVERGEREGRLLPAFREAGIVEFMESLSDSETVEFGEGEKAQKLSQRKHFELILNSIPQLIYFDEYVSRKDLDEQANVLSDERKATLRSFMGFSKKSES